jgi:AbrB family looped-hinge helix DNA binding protein
MELVTVSSKGQIAIPKSVWDALNLSHGAKLRLEVGGRKLCCPRSWRGRNFGERQPGKI